MKQNPVFDEKEVVEYNKKEKFLKLKHKMEFINPCHEKELWIIERWKKHFCNVPYAITRRRGKDSNGQPCDKWSLWKQQHAFEEKATGVYKHGN